MIEIAHGVYINPRHVVRVVIRATEIRIDLIDGELSCAQGLWGDNVLRALEIPWEWSGDSYQLKPVRKQELVAKLAKLTPEGDDPHA